MICCRKKRNSKNVEKPQHVGHRDRKTRRRRGRERVPPIPFWASASTATRAPASASWTNFIPLHLLQFMNKEIPSQIHAIML